MLQLKFKTGTSKKLYKESIKERDLYQESCGIVRLYNFIVSNYVELLTPSNQMSTVKLLNPSASCEFDVLFVLFVLFFSFSIF
jgi:hypothetical protein